MCLTSNVTPKDDLKGAKSPSPTLSRLSWPETQASIFAKWTYSFLNPILDLDRNEQHTDPTTNKTFTRRRQTNEEDLWTPDEHENVASLNARFLNAVLPPSLSSSPPTADEATKNFIFALFKFSLPTLTPAFYCQLVVIVCQTSTPILLKAVIEHVQDASNSIANDKGMPDNFKTIGIQLSFIMLALTLGQAVFTQRVLHHSFRTGARIRALTISLLYCHSLKLPASSSSSSSTSITSLVAIDTQKLFEMMQDSQLIWSAPLQIIIVSILLYIILGPQTIIGIIILAALVPIVKLITSQMIAIRNKRMPILDKRVKACTELLSGIKIAKMNGWETKFLDKIEAIRTTELTYVTRELFTWGITLCVMVMSPVLATAAVFTIYVLTEGNRLNAGDTFAVLCLFGGLRFPINNAARLLSNASQGYKSAERISAFLNISPAEDLQSREPGLKEDEPLLLSVERGGFEIGGSSAAAAVPDRDHPVNNKDDKWGFQARNMPSATVVDSLSPIDIEVDLTASADLPASSSQIQSKFTLKNIDLTIQRNTLTAIIGAVGSGKSVLLSGLLNFIPSTTGMIRRPLGKDLKTSFAAQVPFIMNASLRDNILFGNEFNARRYVEAVKVCCLEQDFISLKGGDLVEIGEKGVTLSGGQKSRVSCARALYAASDVIILDDPLSALDAATGRNLFDKLKESWLIEDKGVVLVTHATHFLTEFNQIVLMHEGEVRFSGRWDELLSFEPPSSTSEQPFNYDLGQVLLSLKAVSQEGKTTTINTSPPTLVTLTSETGRQRSASEAIAMTIDSYNNFGEKTGIKLMEAEVRGEGVVKFSTFKAWFLHAGGWPFIVFQVVFLALDRGGYVFTEYWLARWTEASVGEVDVLFGQSFPKQTDVRSQRPWLTVYLISIGASTLFVFLRSQWAVFGGARATKALFFKMVNSIILAPMSFFESTPLGRLLNRFTYDVENLDIKLTQQMSVSMIASSWFVAGVLVMVSILPWMLLVLVPISYLYYRLQLFFRRTSVDLQRLDAKSRSPIQSKVSELLDGIETIKAFNKAEDFERNFCERIDVNTEAVLAFTTAQRWIGLRIDLCGVFVTTAAVALVVLTYSESSPLQGGIVGLLLNWTTNFSITLQFLIIALSEAEAALTSVERVLGIIDVEHEALKTIPSTDSQLDPSWPQHGELKFNRVSARYRKKLGLALNNMSFTCKPGSRVGVVGRTGAGKSTITSVLFRLIECASGSIEIDDVDLGKLGLDVVRGREHCLSIIPQDPTLFEGTLRSCIDVFSRYTDAEVLASLIAVRLCTEKDKPSDILNRIVVEGGKNYSAGERQLLCLARALLTQPKILVCDEATASVDGETDAFIQKMLRSKFEGVTILCVAHRLNTIMDYDEIMVVDEGRIKEVGNAVELMGVEGGLFKKLVLATGEESSKGLVKIAEEALVRKKMKMKMK